MFKGWFQKKPQVATNGTYHHGNAHLIEIRNVVKTFQSAAGMFAALKGINFHIERGEFVAIIGKSGSGKSTLMNMITGIDRPTSGGVFIGNTAVHTLDENRLAVWRGRTIGIVFQFFQLLPALSLVENVMLPMELCGMYAPRQRRVCAMELLDQVGMADHAHKLPSAISGGQQQRVAIARALANDPPIIMADEPTGNLDSKTAAAIFELFARLANQGKTIVMVTHDSDFARSVDRSVIVADGEIINEYVVHALAALNIDQLGWVAGRLQTHQFAPGIPILQKGDPADRFYIITRGEVEVFLEHPGGAQIIVDRLERGQYFGEIGLIGDGHRTASARAAATTAVEVVTLDRESFLSVLAESEAAKADLDSLVRRRAKHQAGVENQMMQPISSAVPLEQE
jgi:ABC-type lipoprotein export system ATPase subunit